MADNNRIEELKKKRPKKGTYKTFTSLRDNSRIPFQKARYTQEGPHGSRILADEPVSVTVQKGKEFDAWRECLGSEDGKIHANPYFRKLCVEGYKKGNKKEFLDPAELQDCLVAFRNADSNRILFWDDRPKTDLELRMETVVADKEREINSRDMTIGKLREFMVKKGVKAEELQALGV